MPRRKVAFLIALYAFGVKRAEKSLFCLGLEATCCLFVELRVFGVKRRREILLGIPSKDRLLRSNVYDAIGPPARQRAMRNHDRRNVFEETVESGQQTRFGQRVQR